MRELDYDTLLHLIYEAALNPADWPLALAKLGSLLDTSVGGAIFVRDAQAEGVRILGTPDRDASIADYVANWSKTQDPVFTTARRSFGFKEEPNSPDIITASAALQQGQVCTDDMFIDHDALTKTAFYNEHLAKFDFYYAVGAKVWERPGGSGILTLSRAKSQGSFSTGDVRFLEHVLPHLQRAVTMSQRFAWARVGGGSGEAGIEQARCATLLLDQSGLCVHANTAAELILKGTEGLKLVKGVLQARDPAVNDQLALGIGLAVRGDRHGRPTASAIAVRRPSDRQPLAVLVGPVGEEQDWFLPQRPRALVTIVDPEVSETPATERLKALFTLTPSETAVAIGIGQGRELKAVAADLHLTDGSARQYLSRVYAKTRTTRQNDLARLLLLVGAV